MAVNNGCTPSFVQEYAHRQGFMLDKEQSAGMAGYITLLMQWNKVMNLAGAHHWRDALEQLIIDSFHLNIFLREQVLPLLASSPHTWDLGAGAGLPGIPLRILWNEGEYTLVESREKRTIFLSTVLSRYPLKGTHVFRGRAENFMEGKKADLIVSRAFMPWKELLSFVRGHLNPGGNIVFLTLEDFMPEKGMNWQRTAHAQYSVGKTIRHFCAFAEQNTSV